MRKDLFSQVALAWLQDLKMRQLWKINWGESLQIQTKHRDPKSRHDCGKCKYKYNFLENLKVLFVCIIESRTIDSCNFWPQ